MNNERTVTGSTGRHWGPPLTWQQGARGRGREDGPREGHLKGKACTMRASGDGIPASRAARITRDLKRSGLAGGRASPSRAHTSRRLSWGQVQSRAPRGGQRPADFRGTGEGIKVMSGQEGQGSVSRRRQPPRKTQGG